MVVLEVRSLLRGSMKNTFFVLISPRLLLMAAVPQTKYQMCWFWHKHCCSCILPHFQSIFYLQLQQKNQKSNKCSLTLITLRIVFLLNLDLISNQNWKFPSWEIWMCSDSAFCSTWKIYNAMDLHSNPDYLMNFSDLRIPPMDSNLLFSETYSNT